MHRQQVADNRAANPRPALTKADRLERRAKEREREEEQHMHCKAGKKWDDRLIDNLPCESDVEQRWRDRNMKSPWFPWCLEERGIPWDASAQKYKQWPENDWACHRGLLYGTPLDKDANVDVYPPFGTYYSEFHWRMNKLQGKKSKRFPEAFLEVEGIRYDEATDQFQAVSSERAP